MGGPPASGTVYTSVTPSYWPAKATVLPSGEMAGNASSPVWLVSRRAAPPAAGTCHKSPSAMNTTVSRCRAGWR